MRNIAQHPMTDGEALAELAKLGARCDPELVGDIRPSLLRLAVGRMMRATVLEHGLRDLLAAMTPALRAGAGRDLAAGLEALIADAGRETFYENGSRLDVRRMPGGRPAPHVLIRRSTGQGWTGIAEYLRLVAAGRRIVVATPAATRDRVREAFARTDLEVEVAGLADLPALQARDGEPGVLCIDEHHDVDHRAILAAVATTPGATVVEIDGRVPSRRAA